MTAWVVALVALLLVVLLIRTMNRRVERYQASIAGPSGPVPLSSAALNAQLIRDAQRGIGSKDLSTIMRIVELVDREDYIEALALINGMLEAECSPEVRVLLLWTKSNIYARMEEVAQEVGILEQLIAIRTHPLFELNLGVAKSKSKDYEDAKAHYLRAIGLMQGRYPLAIYNLGILYCIVGDKDSAAQQLSVLKTFGRDVPPNLTARLAQRVSEIGSGTA